MAYDGTLKFNTSLDASDFQKGANRMTDIVKGMGVFKILSAGFELIKNSIQAAFGRIDTMAQFERVMNTMTGSARTTNATLSKTNDIVKGTAYGLDVAARSVQNFVSRGMDVSKATATVEAWGDAVAFYGDGTNATFDAVTSALSKMQTKGNVTMEHMEMLFNAGIPALDIYASKVGLSTAEVSEQMSKGELKSYDFIFALNEAFQTGTAGFPAIAGAAKQAGSSWAGTFDNMRAAVTRGTQAFINAVEATAQAAGMPTVKSAVAGVGKFIEGAMKTAAQAVVPLIKNMDLIAPAVITAAAATTTYKVATLAATAAAKAANVDISKGITLGTLSATIDGLKTKAKTALAASTGNATAALALLTAGEGTAATVGTLLTVKDAALAAVKGVLTGQISLATAAQLVWNAALNANPIGLIIAGIALLVAGIIGLITWLSRGSEEYRKQKKEVEDLATAQENLANAQEESAAAHEDNMKSIEAEAAASEKLAGKLGELASKENKTAEEKRRMEAIVRQLNESTEGLNLTYDAENDLLSMNVDEVNELIAAKKDMAKANALQERYADLLKEEALMQEELILITQQRLDIEQQYEDGLITLREKNKLLEGLQETEDAYTLQAEENAQRLQIVDEQIAACDTTTAQTVVDNSEAQIAAAEELAAAEEAALERRKERLESYTDTATDMFSQISTESETSVADMIANLEHNQQAMETWADNLVALADRGVNEGLLQQLRDAGPESAGHVQALVDASDEELARLSELFGEGASVAVDTLETELAIPDGANPGVQLVDDIATGIETNPAMAEATTAAVEGAQTALIEAVAAADFTGAGKQIIDDVIAGINENKAQIGETVNTIPEAVDLSSVSEKMSAGFDAGSRNVQNIVNAMKTTVVSTMRTMGTETGATVTQGVNQMATTYQTGATRVTTTVSNMRNQVGATMRTMSQESINTKRNMWDTLASTAQAGATRVTNTLTQMKNQALATLRSMASESKTAVSGMMDGIASEIASGAAKVTANFTNMKNNVLNIVRSMSSEAQNETGGMMDGMASKVNGGAGKMEQAMNNAMAGMLRSMINHAPSLYAKADEIAAEIARRLNKGFDNRSPSHLMQRIFGFVMLGMLKPMVDKARLLYAQADTITEQLQKHLQMDPDQLQDELVFRVRYSLDAGQGEMGGRFALAPAGMPGGSTIIYESNMDVQVTSPKPMNEYELTREVEDLDKRRQWRIP